MIAKGVILCRREKHCCTRRMSLFFAHVQQTRFSRGPSVVTKDHPISTSAVAFDLYHALGSALPQPTYFSDFTYSHSSVSRSGGMEETLSVCRDLDTSPPLTWLLVTSWTTERAVDIRTNACTCISLQNESKFVFSPRRAWENCVQMTQATLERVIIRAAACTGLTYPLVSLRNQ